MKKFLYIFRRAPHGTNYAQEGLEVALIGAAFDQHVCLAFVDDGVFQLVAEQDTRAIGSKNFSATYRALSDYEVRAVYVERESLAQRGLTDNDLLLINNTDETTDNNDGHGGKSLIKIIDTTELRALIAQVDVIFNF